MLAAETGKPVDRRVLRERVNGTLKRLSRTGNLPALPGVASAALALARDPDADFDELGKIIRTDVGLTARVLRVANSVGYGRAVAAKTIKEAVLTVGLRKTCDLLVVACARQLYDTPSPHSQALWKHSLATAIAAEELARVTKRVDPSSAFLPGLFHDVGRIAFLLAEETSYEVIAGLRANGSGEGSQIEREWYEFDHAEASAVLADEWGLGHDQAEAIRHHHAPQEAGEQQKLAEVLNAADYLAYVIGCGTSDLIPNGVSIEPLGLSDADLAAVTEKVEKLFNQQHELLG